MGPLGIELLLESVERGLLLKRVHTWRTGGFFLERQMHALVPAILLGMTGFDALDLDAESEPPDGKLAQIEQGIGGGEGHAVVGADGIGQTTFLEQPFALRRRMARDALRGIGVEV